MKPLSSCRCSVTRTVTAIIKAQNMVSRRHSEISCRTSIAALRGDHQHLRGDTTIPFMLYCKDGQRFCAHGIKEKDGVYVCVKSSIFRAVKRSPDHSSCAVLELLIIHENHPSHYTATGTFIKVDLSCFCSIRCLGTTTPRKTW
ncbi:hypothetical protein GLV97_10255 [Halobacillus litoralis]|nr:hypothetical protein [Halobacillus litoralis]